MADIRHRLGIKATPDKVYKAITTQEGIQSWWCKQTVAKPEVGFVNSFTFGPDNKNDFKITGLETDQRVSWVCIQSIGEWMDTTVVFELEAKEDRTILRFAHADWKNVTDTFAGCNYDWARFLASLKSYCETGTGNPV